jgi:hypothetical protein
MREELVRRRPQHIHEQSRADERNEDDDQAEDDRANVMRTAVGGSREVGCARRSLAKAAGLVASLGGRRAHLQGQAAALSFCSAGTSSSGSGRRV